MANPSWFDYDYYMSAKLAQLKSADPANWTADKTVADVKAAFEQAGFVGEEGAYTHYVQFGDAELVSPSEYLNTAEYYAAKLAQLQRDEPDKGWTQDQMMKAFKDAGLTAAEHYVLYGAAEGVNPSNAFDDAGYMAAKLAQLQATEPDHGWTAGELQTVFTEQGFTPLSHYLAFGKAEGIAPQAVADPVTPIRPYDPGTSFTLTEQADTFIGTAHNDTVTGALADLAGDTLLDTSSADWDVINLTADTTVETGSANVTGFEVLNVDWQGFGDATIDAAGFKGLKEINASSVKVGFLGNLTVDHAGSATVKAGDGMKGDLVVNGVNGGTVDTGKAASATVALEDVAGSTATVKLAGALSEVTVNGSAGEDQAATVVFAADGTVHTDETLETLTINAGGKTVTVDQTTTAAANTIVTAGTGDVVLKMAGADFGSKADTVTKGNTGTLTVDIAKTAATIDTTKISADTILLSAAGNTAVTAKSGQNFAVTADLAVGSFEVAGGGTSDTVAVSYSANQGTSTTFTGIETAAITAAADKLTFAKLVNTGHTVAMLGTSDVTINLLDAKVLNAAAMEGDLTVTTDAAAAEVTVSGATGDNTVTFDGNATKATFVGQDGADTVDFGTVVAAAKSTAVTGGGDDTVIADASDLRTGGGILNIETGTGDDTVELSAKTATDGKIVLQFGEGNDTLTLNNDGTKADFTGADLTITGLENIIVGTQGATFNAAQLSGQTLTVKSAAGAGTEILTLNGTSSADTIDLHGFTVSDLRASYGSVKVDGAAGDDTIILGSGDFSVGLGTKDTAGIDTITGFNKGDTLSFSGTPTTTVKVVDNAFDGMANLDAVLATFAAGQSHELAENTAVTFSYQGDTYVMIDGGTDGFAAGTDAVVKLAGLSVDQVVALGGDIYVA